MKHVLSLIILSTMLCSNVVYAQEDFDNVTTEITTTTSNQLSTLDKTLKKEIQDAIIDIYGKDNADEIYGKFIEKVENSIKSRPKELLEQDKQRIIEYYRERGYADVQILDVTIDTSFNDEKQRNELTINFIIQEGAQYTFVGLEIKGNEVFSVKELLKQQKLKSGAIYNETKFQEDLATIQSVYFENGYMSNEYYPMPLKNTERHEISYVLTIVEHSRSHIENIIIKGNNKTKENVIKREIPIEEGDIFSREKILNGIRNLMNLQYFSNIIPEPQQGSEENLVDLVWTVEEQSTSNIQFGMTFSGITEPNTLPISLFLKIENSNLFGEGKTISS